MQFEKNDVGRYEDNVAEYLHKKATTEAADTVGSTEDNGFKAMLLALTDVDREELDEAGHGYDGAVSAIVIEDDQGFITVEVFQTDEDAASAWEGYSGDAENGDGEERRNTVSDKAPPEEDGDDMDEEPVAVSVEEQPATESVGKKFAAATGYDKFIISKQLPHRGVCSACSREGRMFQYGFRDRASNSTTWHEEPFCNQDCMRSFYDMSESKRATAPAVEDRTGAAHRVALGLRLIEGGMAAGLVLDKVLSGRILTEQESLYMAIKPGDTVSVTGPDGQKIAGVAIKKTSDGWVLDVNGDAQGMATKDTVVSVQPPMSAEPDMLGLPPPDGAEPLPPDVGAPADLPPLDGPPGDDEMPAGIGDTPEEPPAPEMGDEGEDEEEEELEF